MSSLIVAPNAPGSDGRTVTGEDFDAGTKRALHVAIAGALAGSFSPSGLNVGGLHTVVSINSSTWTALPATALTNRNQINIQNYSGVEIKLNYDNTVVGYVGVVLADQAERFYQITDSIVIYAKSSAGTVNVDVEELA